MGSPRQSVTGPGADCRSDRHRRLATDGGQRRGRFTLEQRVALAREIWAAKGYETTARTKDSDTYVLARNDHGTTELIRIAGEQPSSEAPLGTIESLRDEYEFDTAYYFDPDRSLQPLETNVRVLDRKQIARIVSRIDLAAMIEAENTDRNDAAERATKSGETQADPKAGTAVPESFEAPTSTGDTIVSLYVVGGVVATLAASGLTLGGLFFLFPNVDLLMIGALLAAGLSGWIGYGLSQSLGSNQTPILRIDADGIHVRRWSRVRSIPWAQVSGVYLERRPISVWDDDWLAIEVTDFGGEMGPLDRLQTRLGNLLADTDGTAYRIRTDRYEADFEEIRAAVDRYAEIPVEERE